MTFGNFAEAVLHAAGLPIRPMTRLMKRELVRQIIVEQSARGRLSHFQSIAETAGLVDLVCEFISELKRLEIWPDEFRRACAGARPRRQGRRTVGNLRRLSAGVARARPVRRRRAILVGPRRAGEGRGERGEGRGTRAGHFSAQSASSPLSHRRRRLHRLHADAARNPRDPGEPRRGDVRHAAAGSRSRGGRSVRQAAEDAGRASPAASPARRSRNWTRPTESAVAGHGALGADAVRESASANRAEAAGTADSAIARIAACRPRHRNPRRGPAGGRNRTDRRPDQAAAGRRRGAAGRNRRRLPLAARGRRTWSTKCSAGWAFPSCSSRAKRSIARRRCGRWPRCCNSTSTTGRSTGCWPSWGATTFSPTGPSGATPDAPPSSGRSADCKSRAGASG